MTWLPLRRTALALAALLVSVSAGAQSRAITDTDLFDFVWVADPQMSPDGARVAFVRVTVDKARDQYDTALWVVAADGQSPPRPLTAGSRDTSPRWSADGTRLAFTRAVEKDGRPQPPQIFVLDMRGGEARAVTDIPRGAGNPDWSPDGRTLAFTSTARPDELAGAAATRTPEARVSDVRVITDARYRANGIGGSGFLDLDRPAQIWTVAVPAAGATIATPAQITSGAFAAGNHGWSRDGSRIFFVADRRREPSYLPGDSDLYAVAAGGGEAVRVASIDGGIEAWAESPDRRRLAFVGTPHGDPVRSYSQSDLWIVDLPEGTPRNLTAAYDFDVNGSLGGDQRAPRGGAPAGPIWMPDGRVLIRTGVRGEANLVAIDTAAGTVSPITEGAQDVMAYTAAATGATIAFVGSTPTTVGDLYARSVGTAGPGTRLTSFNAGLFSTLTLNEPEEIWFDSFDGTRIQGWYVTPPGFDGAKPHPLILEIHGGPHSAYGSTFTHEFQWLAAKGYVVLYVNPRGSSNYGQAFGNSIQFAYPGDDYKDLMAGVDALLARGFIDRARMGVTGGSGGGLLTNWVVTQTDRFKAAVSQRDISDWANFWYTADFTLFTPTWFRKPPFEDPEDFARRSPITYVERIHTPLMFILGDEDFRTPPAAGGEDLFRALKYLKRPTVMVRFPNESHDLSRSGRPWHRVERLRHIAGWFDQWLLGQDAGTYAGATPAAK